MTPIRGKLGNDTVTGGPGADTFMWFDGDRYDAIVSTASPAAKTSIVPDPKPGCGRHRSMTSTGYADGNDLLVGVVANENYDFAEVRGNYK